MVYSRLGSPFCLVEVKAILKLDQKPTTIEEVKQEIDFYRQKMPELRGLLDLYYDLFEIELSYVPKIRLKLKKRSDAEIKKSIEEGAPLLDTKALPVDNKLFNKAINDIGHIIMGRVIEQKPELEEPLDKLLSHPDLTTNDNNNPSPFVENLLAFDTSYFTRLAESIALNNEVLFFIAYHAISPFIEKASFSFRDKFDYQKWQNGVCPICGKKPAMAKLRMEDGLRVLQCSLCRSWWSYPRLKCVVCGNDDQETLEYFYAKEDQAHRVNVCNKCKKYIKTTDCRQLERDVNLEVEDLATVYLDLVAKERGYEPGGRITFAVSAG